MKIIMRRPILSGIVAALIIVFVYVLAWLGYGQGVGFQAYQPTDFPPGLKTTTAELYVIRRGHFGINFDKHISIYFNKPNSWIAEGPAGSAISLTCQAQPAGIPCESHVTPKGQKYIISVGEIIFEKGATEIDIFRDMPNQHDREALIDSFQPAKVKINRTIRTYYSA